MKYLLTFSICLLACFAFAWQTLYLDVPILEDECHWRDALAVKVTGSVTNTEIAVIHGRIDVVTSLCVIEVDYLKKWHEGLGQALHYSDATGKQGVVALIVTDFSPKAKLKLAYIEQIYANHDIGLIVLTRNP